MLPGLAHHIDFKTPIDWYFNVYYLPEGHVHVTLPQAQPHVPEQHVGDGDGLVAQAGGDGVRLLVRLVRAQQHKPVPGVSQGVCGGKSMGKELTT